VTTVYLVRHAAHERVHDTLCGRRPGVALSETGRAQAERLATCLAECGIAAVRTSPVQRAVETATPIARRLGLKAERDDGLNEVDFGEGWTGRRFDSLASDPAWRAWNAERATAATPAGDTMRAVQKRVWAAVERARADHPDGSVVLVSHAEVIRAAMAHVLRSGLDLHQRLEIGPACVSAFRVTDDECKLLYVNVGRAA
jgi:probable phosphoglycerate mutase